MKKKMQLLGGVLVACSLLVLAISVAGAATNAVDNDDASCSTLCVLVDDVVDIAVSVSENVDPVVAGSNGGVDNLIHTYTVTNNGPDTATNILLEFSANTLVAPSLSFSAGNNLPPNAAPNEWWIPSLTSGDSATMTLTWDIGSNYSDSNPVFSSLILLSVDQPDTDSNNNSATEGTRVVGPPIGACPAEPEAGAVGPDLTTLLGMGMGSPTRQKLMGKLTVPNTADLTDLYGQLAAKEHTAVKFVRFIYPEKNAGYIQVDPETDLGEKAAISWWGADLDENELLNKPFVKGRFFLNKGMRKMKTPRAFVLYMTHQTEGQYANAWSTFTSPNNFVAGAPGFPQTNSNILSIPETQDTTDITVQLAITDVNRDTRTVDVIVRAGGVEVTTTLTGPTNKKSELLNLFEVTLEDVPAGVDEVEIELVSILDEGDSAALLGAAASYVCEEPAP